MTADQGADAEARAAGLETTGAGAAFCGELVEHMLDGFSLLTPDGVHLEVNPALCEMTGFSREELVGAGPPHPYWPPEEDAAIQAAFQKTLEGRTGTFPLTFMRKNGERFPVLVTPSVLRDAEGTMISAFALVKDMSELRAAEAALAESERLFRLTFDQAPIGAALVGIDFRFRRVNARFAHMTGYSVDELLVRGFPDVTHPDDVDADVVEVKRLAAGEIDEYAREKRYVRKDGSIAWGDVVVRPVTGDDGRPLAFVAMVAEVTERRAAEEKLRAAEEQFRALVEQAPIGIYLTDANGDCTLVNPLWSKMAGLSQDEALGQGWLRGLHPDDRATIGRRWYRSAQSAGAWGFEYRFRDPAGKDTWVYGTASPLHDPQGQLIGYMGVNTDITARKAAEAETAKTQRLLREAQEISKLGGWEYDVATERISWTDEVYRIHGVEPGFDINDVDLNIDFYLPEDRPVIAAAFRGVVESGTPYDLDLRFRAADGRRLWVRTMARAITEGGRVVRVTGNIVDITERKLNEEALRESEAKYRDVVERAGDGIVMTDEGRILFANDAFARMSGHAGNELAGMPFLDFVPEDQRAMIANRVRRRLAGDEIPARYEIDLLRKDGTRFSVEASAGVITVAGAPRDLVLLHDITKRKAAEEEIRRLNAELEQRVVSRTEQLDASTRELEALAYSIAHDVRAPLRTIDGFSAAVMEDEAGALSDEAIASLQRVRAAAQTLARLLDDLTGLSRASQRELVPQTVDLTALAEEVGREVALEHPARAVELVVTPGLRAEVDPMLARIILRELLGNAWKFTAVREVAHVKVGALEEDGRRAFFVRDDGAGFDMRYAEHLFGVFQRMHPPGEFAGDGVGLAMVHRLVRRHGGSCWAEAEPDAGATFYFTLPGSGTGEETAEPAVQAALD